MTESRPNVVWVTLESVRADHTSVHGYGRDTTPNLERIAARADGARFGNCFSQSIWTPASSASMLTGTHLFRHGVGLDGNAEEPLRSDLRTVPELLGENGYLTACLSSNPYLSAATGLDRGFEKFSWLSLKHLYKHRETVLPMLAYIARLRTYAHGFSLEGHEHNLTYVMQRVLQRWVRSFSRGDDPFFLYVHCPNPHLPYTPPEKYIDRYLTDDEFAPEAALDLSFERYGSQERVIENIADGADFTDREWRTIEALYDAEIAYADELVGRLFDTVEALDGRETVFVVTGDHGDLFGEQGLVGHNLVLDDGLTNVPLVTHNLDTDEVDTESLVQHIDVTRTVAARLGCDHEQFQGRPLSETPYDTVISQRGVAQFESYLDVDPGFDTDRFHADPVSAVRTGEFKYLESEARTELFRLPDETEDVEAHYPHTAARLRAELGRRIDDPHPTAGPSADETNFTPEMREQLSDLGYI